MNQLSNVASDMPTRSQTPSDDEYSFNVRGEWHKNAPKIRVRINKTWHTVLVDSGSSVNTVNTYIAHSLSVEIMRASTKLFAYATETPLTVQGQFTATVESKHNNMPLLSYETACELGVLKNSKQRQHSRWQAKTAAPSSVQWTR